MTNFQHFLSPLVRWSERVDYSDIEDMLRAFVIDFGGSWDFYLPYPSFLATKIIISTLVHLSYKLLYRRKCLNPFFGERLGIGSWGGKLGPRFIKPFRVVSKVRRWITG